MTYYAYDIESLGPYVVDPMEHLALARWIARRFKCPHLDAEDIEQEALAALCVAARNHDATKGASFGSWASTVMRWHLRGAVTDNARTGRFGSRAKHRALLQGIRRWTMVASDVTPETMRDRMFGSCGKWTPEDTTDDEVARAFDFVLRPEIRLDRETSRGSDSPGSTLPLVETIADEAHEEDTEHAALMAAWSAVLESVPTDDRERDILDKRLLTDSPDTLQEIGDRWGITRERVRQIEERLIRRLRDAAIAAGLKAA